jgi:hypothetical protein
MIIQVISISEATLWLGCDSAMLKHASIINIKPTHSRVTEAMPKQEVAGLFRLDEANEGKGGFGRIYNDCLNWNSGRNGNWMAPYGKSITPSQA